MKNLRNQKTGQDFPVRIIFTLIMAGVGSFMLLPFAWMISASFKLPVDIWNFPVDWIPDYWYPDNYIYVFNMRVSVQHLYFNSIKVTALSVLGAAFTSTLAAYGYSRIRFAGRDLLFLAVIATLMIPRQVLYVPRFIMFSWFDKLIPMMDHHNSLILPGLFSAFGLFLLRQFFLKVPQELSESAMIDGAGHMRIWLHIMLPLAKPAIATFIIITFTHHWNDYESPLIFIRTPELATIPLGLANFADERGLQYHYIMALSSLAIVPMFLIFLVGQKLFVRGLTAGAIKE